MDSCRTPSSGVVAATRYPEPRSSRDTAEGPRQPGYETEETRLAGHPHFAQLRAPVLEYVHPVESAALDGEAVVLEVDRTQSGGVLLEVGYIHCVQVEVPEVVRM